MRQKVYLTVLVSVVLSYVGCMVGIVFTAQQAGAQATRTFNSPRNVRRKLALQFNGSTEVFTTVNPDAAGTPLTLTSATGISGMDGSVTLVFRAGVATKTITAFT